MTSTAFATTIYKWTDSEGNIHYTQNLPEEDAEYTTINPPPKIESEQSQKNLEQRQKLLNESREQRLKKAAEKQAADEEKARREKNCELARANLNSYTRPRVQFVQEDGSRIRATEEERQQQIKKAQEMIKEFCK